LIATEYDVAQIIVLGVGAFHETKCDFLVFGNDGARGE
jgi:hypothetical protein